MNCKTLRGAIMYYPPYPPRSQQDLRNYHQFVPSYEEYEEKNQIRRQANKIGLTMVGNRFFYLIFSLFSSFFLLLIGLMSVDYYSGTYEYDLTGMTLFSMIILCRTPAGRAIFFLTAELFSLPDFGKGR